MHHTSRMYSMSYMHHKPIMRTYVAICTNVHILGTCPKDPICPMCTRCPFLTYCPPMPTLHLLPYYTPCIRIRTHMHHMHHYAPLCTTTSLPSPYALHACSIPLSTNPSMVEPFCPSMGIYGAYILVCPINHLTIQQLKLHA